MGTEQATKSKVVQGRTRAYGVGTAVVVVVDVDVVDVDMLDVEGCVVVV